jgi:hypothetical protein
MNPAADGYRDSSPTVKSVVNILNAILSNNFNVSSFYEDVSKSFRTGLLERELQMVQLSETRCSESV